MHFRHGRLIFCPAQGPFAAPPNAVSSQKCLKSMPIPAAADDHRPAPTLLFPGALPCLTVCRGRLQRFSAGRRSAVCAAFLPLTAAGAAACSGLQPPTLRGGAAVFPHLFCHLPNEACLFVLYLPFGHWHAGPKPLPGSAHGIFPQAAYPSAPAPC